MKYLLRLLAFLAFTAPLIAADGEPYNMRFLQRNATGSDHILLDYQGTDYPNTVFGFSNTGVWGPLALQNFLPSSTALQVFRRNAANNGYEFATLSPGVPDLLQNTFLGRFSSGTGPAEGIVISGQFSIAGGVLTLANEYIPYQALIADLSDGVLDFRLTLNDGLILNGPLLPNYPALLDTDSDGQPEMDLTQAGGRYTATSNVALEFKGTPAVDQPYPLLLSADGSPRTITIPSAYDINNGVTVTSVSLVANQTIKLGWARDSARWLVSGLPAPTSGSGAYLLVTGGTASNLATNARAYGVAWNNSTKVPTEGDIYTKIESLLLGSGTGDVTASAVFGADNRVITSDGTGKGVKASSVSIVGGVLSGVTSATIGTLNTTDLLATNFLWEGTTPDGITTRISVENPTSNRNWRIPNLPDTDFVGTAAAQTLSNKTISGASNTISNVPAATALSGLVPVANGGTGTATPGLIAGSNVTIGGTWPNQTISASGGGGGSNLNGSVSVTVDGGGSVLTAGTKGFIVLPHTGTVSGWSIVADQAGTVTFDIEKAADGVIPTSLITPSGKPALAGTQILRSSSTTGWTTTSIAAYDVLEFLVTGTPTNVTRATLQLHYDRGTAGSFGTTVDGGGSVLTSGSKGFVVVPFACTLTGWSIVGDQSGSVTFDLEKAVDGSIPTTSITPSGKPALAGTQILRSSSTTGWTTTSVAANDVIEFLVSGSPSNVTRATIQIHYTR